MEIILSLVIIASTFMVNMDNSALRLQNETLRFENQKLLIQQERDKKSNKHGKYENLDENVSVVYSMN